MMTNVLKTKAGQPEALAELAKTSREKIPGDGDRDLAADSENKPLTTDIGLKHDVAEKLLSAGAHGKEPDPKQAGVSKLPDRTRTKK
jgi:hypothetical protein